ncbi:peptide deformylase, partial [Bacillus spizizenii]|nr:peptide deformylase [Bacillus spizizenii]
SDIDHLNGVMLYDNIDKENPFKEPEHAIAIER